MKKSISLTIILVTVAVLACQDSREDAKRDPEQIAAYKSIGHQIPTATGMRWIETYNQRTTIEGRVSLILSGYSVSASNVKKLTSLPGLVGIAFHHALDSYGIHHYIAIPVGEDLSVWSEATGKIFVDANTNTQISRADAADWAGNYKAAYPNEIWFHFFGSNVFDEILEIPYLNDVNIVPALNDLDLSPQLLLVILNPLGGILGRTETEGTTVYDASSPCPPCPVN